MNDHEKVALIVEVHETVAQRVFLHEGPGGDLSHILAAIAKDGQYALYSGRVLADIMRRAFQPEHPVWKFVEIKDYLNEHYGM